MKVVSQPSIFMCELLVSRSISFFLFIEGNPEMNQLYSWLFHRNYCLFFAFLRGIYENPFKFYQVLITTSLERWVACLFCWTTWEVVSWCYSLLCFVWGVGTNWVQNADKRNLTPNQVAHIKLFTGGSFIYFNLCRDLFHHSYGWWIGILVYSFPKSENNLNPPNIAYPRKTNISHLGRRENHIQKCLGRGYVGSPGWYS